MAKKIDAEKCVGCGACAGTCPVEAISQSGDKYVINETTCVDCGACEGACPVTAIS